MRISVWLSSREKADFLADKTVLLNSETQLNYPWESCPPLSNDWGWTPNAPFKSPQKIINILIGIIAKGGCLLLGVGLTPSKTK